MRMPRVRFTVRGMMLAVAVAGIVLGIVLVALGALALYIFFYPRIDSALERTIDGVLHFTRLVLTAHWKLR